MATREDFNAKLQALADRANKAKAEVIAALQALQNTDTTEEQDALLQTAMDAVGGIDDLNADTVTPTPV